MPAQFHEVNGSASTPQVAAEMRDHKSSTESIQLLKGVVPTSQVL